MTELTPQQVVKELDKYIIGQGEAKKSVAIALRNRMRRLKLDADFRDEVTPKNIIMIGPTGVGKTEIARRVAKLTDAPFIKVEASKYTEVGYVGRDVESMIRDLVKQSVNQVRTNRMKTVKEKAAEAVEEKLLDLLVPPLRRPPGVPAETAPVTGELSATREKMRAKLRAGEMEETFVEIDQQVQAGPVLEIFQGPGMEDMDSNLQDMIGNMLPRRKKRRKVKIKDARGMLMGEEINRMVDMAEVTKEAIRRVEESGIVFIDELDKVAGRERQQGPEVSREGVQRDLLPIVEGTTVNTRQGPVKTDHILFMAAGAFNVAKPSDLIPELQGRFPLRVNLDSLREQDFVRILTEPHNALTKQYRALLEVDNVQVQFKAKAVRRLARIAFDLNEQGEQIGARRLHTVMEKLLEDISFDAPENLSGKVVIDELYVEEKLQDLVEDRDLSKYIL